MTIPELEYDVYLTPRIGPVQFGDYVAAEGLERSRILQGAKFFRRSHRVRAWFAKQEINSYIASAKKNIGFLEAAIDDVEARSTNSKFSDEKRQDASASLDCLKKFLSYESKLKLSQKDLIALSDDQYPAKIGFLNIDVDLTCLIKSTSKTGENRVGALFLNTQAGKGLGTREETIAKRNKAGEAVALLALKRVIDEFGEYGTPHPSDTLHYYVRENHHWAAPKSYANRMKNLEAEANTIASLWPTLEEPTDLSSAKIHYHD